MFPLKKFQKNQGISFICVDPTESFIQLFHHCHVIGGGWNNPSKTLVSIFGLEKTAKPIQLILQSVKIIKAKTDSLEELMSGDTINDQTKTKSKKVEFNFRNILPIPHVPTKTCLESESHTPQDVAQAFYLAMNEFDSKELGSPCQEVAQNQPLVEENDQANAKTTGEEDEKSFSSEQDVRDLVPKRLLQEFVHVLQFCQLSYKKKIPPIAYSVNVNLVIESWFQAMSLSNLQGTSIRAKCQQQRNEDSSDLEDDASSPEHKISKKDQVFLSTMLKISDTMDKNYKEESNKEPGFSRLEEHRKNLFLNASALPPYDTPAPQPMEFLTTFLAKKSQFKAKDMILHRLHSEKISFNPGSSFVNNLWNCDFFWLLPDTPSGMSIFFCPETKSASASDIEKDRVLALADKVNLSGIEKLPKQKLYIPNTIMDMVRMTQNFHAVIKFCFGPKAHSAVFLRNWADHMYQNRNMYVTQHASDPYFFTKVLYAIYHALQKHW
jgi:hypothetical protein